MAEKSINRKTPMIGRPALTVAEQRGLLRGRSSEFSIQSIFKYGYRNEEDVSNLPPEVLVVGSQNVLTNASELLAIRNGYTLDGDAGDQNDYGIDSSFDFEKRKGVLVNLRKWGTALETRFINPVTSAISWVNISNVLVALNKANFTTFWDSATELKTFCLFVNGVAEVNEWSGGVGAVESTTANTIVISGTQTVSQVGFYDNAANSADFKLLDAIGTEFTYTGVSGNSFTGVTPDPTAFFVQGDPVVQKPRIIDGSAIATNGAGNLDTFIFDLIGTLENQVWYGSFADNSVYVSITGNYKSTVYTTPVRLASEGARITLDAPPVGFSPQESQMYASAGLDQWWVSQKIDQNIDVAGVAVPTQILTMKRLKTALNQGVQEQSLITRFKNSLIYVSNEPIINALGLVKNINEQPQIVNISDSIKFDVDAYDFTGGDVEYDNYFIYVAIPQNGVVRMYNVNKQYWEAPQTIPVGKFFRVTGDKNIYGHSGITNESYKLFTGTSDNGNPINMVIAFPYVSDQGGAVTQKKNFNKIYTEGYIAANTTLMVTVNYDFGGFSGSYTTIISGSNSAILFNAITDGSLGHNSLGSQPIGTILNLPFSPPVPKFRVINTMPRVDFFDYQIVYATQDDDANVTLLRFGPAIEASQALPNNITF